MRCPFIQLFDVDCVYCESENCNEVSINIGNSDAWCTTKIEQAINNSREKHRQPNPACREGCKIYVQHPCSGCEFYNG